MKENDLVDFDADVLTLPQAAAILKVNRETLRVRAVAWGVPHKRLGSAWRFSRQVLIAWMQQQHS